MGKFCTQCGAPHDDGKFCSDCGTPFPLVGSTPTPTASPPPTAQSAPATPAPPTALPMSPPIGAEPPPPSGAPLGSVASAPAMADSSLAARVKQFAVIDWVHLGAVVAAVVAVFIPWLRSPAGSADAMDVPSLFLINNEAGDRGIEVGMLVFVCAAIALAALVVRAPVMRKLLLGVGVAMAMMGVLFVIQLNRLLSTSYTSLTDALGVGPILLLVAGVALVYVAVQSGRTSQRPG